MILRWAGGDRKFGALVMGYGMESRTPSTLIQYLQIRIAEVCYLHVPALSQKKCYRLFHPSQLAAC